MGEADDRSGPETGIVPDAVREQLAGAGRTSDDGTGLTVVRDTATSSAVPAVPAPVPQGRSISGGWSVVTGRVRELSGRLVGVVVAQPRRWLVVGGAVMAVVIVATAVVVVSTGERDRPGGRAFPGGGAGVPETRDSGDPVEATQAAAAGVAAKADGLAGGDLLTVLRLRLVAFALDPARQRLALAEVLLRTDDLRPVVVADTSLPTNTPIVGAVLSPDGETLLTTGPDTTTRLWDLRDPTKVQPQGSLPAGVAPIVIDREGATLIGAQGGAQPSVSVWGANHLASPQRLATLDRRPVDALAISPDGLLAATAAGTSVTVWSVGIRVSPHQSAALTTAAPVTAVAFTPNGKTLLIGDATGKVTIWSLTDPSRPSTLRTLSGHTGPVTHIAVGPDGVSAVTTDANGGVAAWTIAGTAPAATALTVRPAGQDATGTPLAAGLVVIAAVGVSGSVWSWIGPDQPRQWFPLPFPHPAALPPMLADNGSRAVTVGGEGHLVIWDLGPIITVLADPGKRACELLGGQVTEQQWSDAVATVSYRNVC